MSYLRPRLWIALLLLLQTPWSRATDVELQVSGAELNGYGLFETATSQRRSSYSDRTAGADVVTGVRFTEFTSEIPAVLKTNFGFNYSINTTPRGQKLWVKQVIRFPEPGLHHPGGKVYRESVERKQVEIGKSTLHGYGFDEAWEIVPGEWVFEVWYQKARLIRKTFIVTASGETAGGQ